MKGSFKPCGSFLAMDVSASELQDAVGSERFDNLLSQLEGMKKEEVVKIAKEIFNVSYSSKAEAIKKIGTLHREVLLHRAKKAATGGRSAA